MIRHIGNPQILDFDKDGAAPKPNKFSASLIEEIIENLDILEVLEEEYDLAFEEPTNKGWWHTNCPLPGHRDSTPSFGVNPELRVFKCFGCQEKGNLLHFVRKVEGLSFNDAVMKLSMLAGIDAGNSDVSVFRALKDIDATVKAFLEGQTDSKLPAGLSPVEFMRSLAVRMREYERKVNRDNDELKWVDSIYERIDELDIKEDQRGMSDVWSSLAKDMKQRYAAYQERTGVTNV